MKLPSSRSRRSRTMNFQKSSFHYSQLADNDIDLDETIASASTGHQDNTYIGTRRLSNTSNNYLSQKSDVNLDNNTEYQKDRGGDLDSVNEEDEEEKVFKSKPNVKKDLHNIAFLMLLYLLQGVPLGLTGSLPFILGSRNVSYTDQGTFSFAFWPFCLKLLWAPVVDSLFIKKFGRRKSWLVPMQVMLMRNISLSLKGITFNLIFQIISILWAYI